MILIVLLVKVIILKNLATSTFCMSCTSIIYNNKCYTTCPDKSFGTTINNISTCSDCSSACLNCSGT